MQSDENHKEAMDRVKKQAIAAFGHVDGVTLEDALATMVLMLERHAWERNSALNTNAAQAQSLAIAWREAQEAEKMAFDALTALSESYKKEGAK